MKVVNWNLKTCVIGVALATMSAGGLAIAASSLTSATPVSSDTGSHRRHGQPGGASKVSPGGSHSSGGASYGSDRDPLDRAAPFDSQASCDEQFLGDVSTRMVCKMDHDHSFPFVVKELHVELADGESYVLSGWIRVQGSYVFFQPDFCAHPWLASKARLNEPGYVIIKDSRQDWRAYDNKKVVISTIAHGQIVTRGGGNPAKYILMLEVNTVSSL